MNKRAIIPGLLLFFATLGLHAQSYSLHSPDKKTEIRIQAGRTLTYTVLFKNKTIVTPSELSLTINGTPLGKDVQVAQTRSRLINEVIRPVYGKFTTLTDHCNQLQIDFKQNFSLIIRAYNDAVAYRFVTRLPGEAIVDNENFQIRLNGSYSSLFAGTPKITSWELPYQSFPTTDSIKESQHTILPVLFSNTSDHLRVIVAESDVRDYPGMFLRKAAGTEFNGHWARYPSKTTPYGGEWGMSTSVDAREKFIAKTKGSRSFPWRIVMLCDDDKKLLTNTLIYQLASPQEIKDVSWIKPGKCDWEWWHDAIVEKAGFPNGMANRTTQLYKYYIDFAAENKLEYTLIDAGWSNFYHLDTPSKKVDIKELVAYGKQKNVGILVWCNATSLLSHLDKYLQTFEDWGLKGIKVDFFDRDDQIVIQQMEEIAAKAAARHLLVNFHGCAKPTGLQRTYPNVITFEAVRGEECSKWDHTSNPEYHLQIAFIRMLGGSMDYTPGSMRNRSKAAFTPIAKGLPETQGTRCHELSMFVLYDQYLAVLSDSPDEYRKYPDVLKFLSSVPVQFEDTKVLAAQLGQYALIAKKKDDRWYVGAMTNWDSRRIDVDFSFLGDNRTYKAEIFRDGANADTDAESYVHEEMEVNRHTKLNLRMASGGGAVIVVHPIKKK